MSGIFDRFRFGAKRDRDDSDVSNQDASVEDVHEPSAEPSSTKKSKRKKSSEDVRALVKVEIKNQAPGKWQERWHAICQDCFHQVQPCSHYREHRLRLLIVGHNPSDHAWKDGYSYSNPTNRMWRLLTGTLSPQMWEGILPATAHISEQNIMPHVVGVGFTSIGLEPGNDASKYGKKTMEKWRDSFFQRLRRHAAQVCLSDHDIAVKCEEGEQHGRAPTCKLAHAPVLIAFAGKRQFSWLFSPPLSKIEHYGKQTVLPSGWPHELRADSEVWVLPSSSGRAVMTTAERTLPYQQLAERLRQVPWASANEPASLD